MSAPPSPTQRLLTSTEVTALVRDRFGRTAVHCGPLTGGTFAAVWRATLDDGTEAVVKIGPPAGVPLLRYEQGIIAAEARYYRLAGAAGVPVPPVLDADDEVVLAGLLPGRPLSEQSQDRAAAAAVRRALGRSLHALHTVSGPEFGYDGGRTSAATWPGAFAAMTEDLLADARDWAVDLPVPPKELLAVVQRHADALAEVRTPSLVHFDLWDGNILAEDGRLTGLVDGERYFWGDPLYDFVCTTIGSRMEEQPEHPVLQGYHPGGPPPFTEAQRVRLRLYRLQFCLLLLIEMPSRAMTGEHETERRKWVTPWLLGELAALR